MFGLKNKKNCIIQKGELNTCNVFCKCLAGGGGGGGGGALFLVYDEDGVGRKVLE